MDYNNKIIDISQLNDTLNIFDKNLKDFGLQEEIDTDEIQDLNSMFEGYADEKK
jgi:hypothetical protein